MMVEKQTKSVNTLNDGGLLVVIIIIVSEMRGMLFHLDGALITVRKLSVECWIFLILSGRHFFYVAEEEGPPVLLKWPRKLLVMKR